MKKFSLYLFLEFYFPVIYTTYILNKKAASPHHLPLPPQS
mgnify:CR=1 FL=1